MVAIERTRVIRPSSRKAASNYKVDVEKRGEHDDLHLIVTHESDKNFKKEFHFSASQLIGRKSIHFKWDGNNIILPKNIIPK